MSHISYTDGVTVVPASWLNDLDTIAYTYFGNGSSLNSPTKVVVTQGIFSTSVVTPLVGTATAAEVSIITSGISRWTFKDSAEFQPIGDNDRDIGDATHRVRTGYFGTSVVTPLIGTATAAAVTLQYNNVGVLQYTNSALVPLADNTVLLGNPANRFAAVFTPIIDSGTTGSLSLKTNNGETGFRVDRTASSVNFLAAVPDATTFGPTFRSVGGDANVDINYTTAGTGAHNFSTNFGGPRVNQFQVLHTASATRSITVTGSNGGNPTISTTAGALALGNGQLQFPATQSPSADVNTLDDYEEGTWTPSVGGTATYTLQTGTYTKIGRLVFIDAQIIINSIGTGSTTQLSGLPFPASNQTELACRANTSASTIVSIVCNINGGGATNMTLFSRSGTSAGDTANPIFQNATNVVFSGCYITT